MNTITSSTNLSCTIVESAIIEVMLDRTPYAEKPPQKDPEWPRISYRLSKSMESLPLEDLTDALTKGCSFAPGVFRDGQRTNKTWTQQQLFGLDYDNDDPGNCLTPELFLERCAGFGIMPAFLYPSFRHTAEKNKFRAVFVTDTPITNIRLRDFVQLILMDIFSFPECEPDPNCKDAARFFMGTNKPLLFQDYEQRINPIQLLNNKLAQLKRNDPAHYARNLQTLCANLGLAYASTHEVGVSFLKYVDNDTIMVNFGENTVLALYSNTHTVNSPLLTKIGFEPIVETCYVPWEGTLYSMQFTRSKFEGKSKNKNPKTPCGLASPTDTYSLKSKRRISKEDQSVLLVKCKLLSDLLSGERKIGYRERRRLITNLMTLEGGIKWFLHGLSLRSDYTDDSLISDASRYKMKPESCANCRYAEECDHKTNLLQQIPIKRRECRQIRPSAPREPISETREKVRDAISKVSVR